MSDGVETSRRQAALGFAWMAMIAITALGHATALRNVVTVAVPLVTFAVCLRDWRALPVKAPLTLLVTWAAASLLWSAAPSITGGKLRTDLLLPLFAGLAAFCYVRDGRGLRYVVGGIGLAVFVLASLSAFAWLPVGWTPPGLVLEQGAGIVRPLPRWYPGPGDASMFAILAIAPLTMAWRVAGSASASASASRRETAFLSAAFVGVAFVLVTTNNRNAVLIAPVVVLFQWLLDRRVVRTTRPGPARAGRVRRIALATTASLVAVVALAAVLEVGARQRLEYLRKPMTGDSAAIELVGADTRPMIWRYYVARAAEHPWIGLGFGRTVPGIGWNTERDRQLAAIEPNAYIHAHNVLLNWWLQVGAIGVALLLMVAVAAVRAALRWRRRAVDATRASLAFHALLATFAATFARNLTDDFLVYGMATAFCVVVGALLGESSRLAALAPPIAPSLIAPSFTAPSFTAPSFTAPSFISRRSPSAPS